MSEKFKFNFTKLLVILLVLPFVLSTNPTHAAASFSFNNTSFESRWNRVDRPVGEVASLGRGYTWGPLVQGSDNLKTEIYNGKPRTIQYFEKARMEINNAGGDPNDLFYVTTGLLVKELVTGYRQDSDANFTRFAPSSLQIAGDPNFDGVTNQIAPTYSTFTRVGTFFANENQKGSRVGQVISERLDRAGNVTSITPPLRLNIGEFDDVTNHNIAAEFVNYGNRMGQVWNGSKYISDKVFFGSALYVLGRPVTEPYWVRAVVGGVEQDVLVQLFERRALTYTPDNSDEYKVEMGNIGAHYYAWRYQSNFAQASIELPQANSTAVLPLRFLVRVGQPGEQLTVSLRWQDGTELRKDFTTLRGEDGRGLLIDSLNWDNEGPPPMPPNQNATFEIFSKSGVSLAKQPLKMIRLDDPQTQQLKLYFVLGEEIIAATRVMPKTLQVGTTALEELLWGPWSPNLAGFTTALPTPQEVLNYAGRGPDWGPRVTVRSLVIRSGVATADFSKELRAYGGGSARVQAIRSQITLTLKQFPSITDVRISIEGQLDGVLQP